MAETTSQVNVNDIPEYLKPYRNALLNAAFGLAMKPEYLQKQGIPIMGGTIAPPANPPVQPTIPPTPTSPAPPDQSVPDAMARITTEPVHGGSTLSRGAAGIEELLRSNRIGYAEGGRLANSAAGIEELLKSFSVAPAGSDVWLGEGGTPLGGVYNGNNVSPTPKIPSTIGTGTQPPPTPQPPSVTPPSTAGPGGVITTPPSGTLPVGNPNPTNKPPQVGTGIGGGGGVTQPPPATHGGGPSTPIPQPSPNPNGYQTPPAFLAHRPDNFAGAAQAEKMGYNPNQYAEERTAQDLADRHGAQLVYTNSGGPISPPSQATLYSGGESFQNAGLVNDAYTRFKDDPGQLQLRLNQIRDEIRQLGGTPGFKKGGVVRAFGGAALDSGSNPFNPLKNNSSSGPMDGFMNNGFPVPQSPASTGMMGSKSALNTGFMPLQAQAETDTTGTPTGTPTQQTVAQNALDVLQPYQAYGGQRTLSNGFNSGAVNNGVAQISDLTRNALGGYSGLPSYLDSAGNINAGRTASGQATTNFGIANDTFNSAGQLALDASTRAGDASYESPLTSSFQDTMNFIRGNPQAFQAGEISLGQLSAPQVDAPLGISPSQLTSYQMAGPRLIDTSVSNIDPHYIQGQNLQQYQAQSPESVRGAQYRANTIDTTPTVDTNQITRNFENNRMTAPGNVTAGQIQGIDRFIDNRNAQNYMSPYTQNVTDVRQRLARQAFNEQKAARDANAVKAGAFGGNRQAVADSLANRDLMNQMDQIAAEGAQSAYENAQQQYERDRNAGMGAQQFNVQARMQGDLANQQTGLQVGGKNLDAALATNNLLGNIGLQGLLANQNAGLTVAQANQAARNQSGQFNAANRQQASLANQSANQATALANLQALLGTQQLGANLGQQANLANQSAYMDAASRNQGTNLQAQLANQAALQQANQQNLAAALGVQELGANQSLAAQQANQGAGLQAGLANLQAAMGTQQLARTSGLTAAQANQQTRLAQNQALLDAAAREDQLRQQAQQGNFSNRLSAVGQQTNSALAANQIGQSRADLQRLANAQQLQNLQQQMAAGATIDQRTQGNLDQAYQDFINQRNDPFQKLNWLQGILAGTPIWYNQEQVLFNRTSPASQIGGLATAGLGALTSYLGNKQ